MELVPRKIAEQAQSYANEQCENVVAYEEMNVKFGFDFMLEKNYFENGHPESDIVHTFSPFESVN